MSRSNYRHRSRYDDREPNHVARHWHGDFSLGYSVWINQFLIVGVCSFLCWFAVAQLSNYVTDPRLLISPVVGLLLLYVALQVWGKCRYMARRARRNGRFIRSIIVQMLILLSIPSLAWQTGLQGWMLDQAVRDGQPIEIASASLGIFEPAPRVRVSPDGTEIDFSGPITERSGQRFETALAEAPNCDWYGYAALAEWSRWGD